MKYLLYMQEGFIRKFPINKQKIFIGRTIDNDIVIDDGSISRQHLAVEVGVDSIIIKDLNSINGSFYRGNKIQEVEVNEDESFLLGNIEFIFKINDSEDSSDFSKSASFIPDYYNKNNKTEVLEKENIKYINTDQLKNNYANILEEFLKRGMSSRNINEALTFLTENFVNIPKIGSMFVISNNTDTPLIFFSYKKDEEDFKILKSLIENEKDLYKKRIKYEKPNATSKNIFSIPLKLNEVEGFLIYFSGTGNENNNDIDAFMTNLAKEMELLSSLYSANYKKVANRDKKNSGKINIIAENKDMKTLIKQAIRIAKSDIFVLIEGESGTGKELFARLIHDNSNRKNKDFVALNCAAIPENLLESELFGHEKGAFTGAFALKKGKLEIASSGTLVLDEIGDMPYNLQTKLLRALQENEFYRLGGNTAIKVDLRIISITNRNLKELIEKKEFREDLYYRLVHRNIFIPPLRDRVEDIPILINYFTNKFCNEYNRKISGYSIKAFETLQNYFWKGNIRQLENEVKSIVNLTDDDEMICYDILSDEIKAYAVEGIKKTEHVSGFYKKPDKETIINILNKNNWNKSKTAKELNMTYRGLHKKLERLNIKFSDK